MARVTVEDCIEKVDTRFELIMVASQRARDIGTGAELTIDRDNDKNTVVSLREVAQETVAPDEMIEKLIRARQRVIHTAEDDEEIVDLMSEDYVSSAPEDTFNVAIEAPEGSSVEAIDSPLSDLASSK